jgi:hypothetical protein
VVNKPLFCDEPDYRDLKEKPCARPLPWHCSDCWR